MVPVTLQNLTHIHNAKRNDGKLNPDRLCKVIEQILSERDENIEVKVRLISEEEAVEIRRCSGQEIIKSEDEVNNGSVQEN